MWSKWVELKWTFVNDRAVGSRSMWDITMQLCAIAVHMCMFLFLVTFSLAHPRPPFASETVGHSQAWLWLWPATCVPCWKRKFRREGSCSELNWWKFALESETSPCVRCCVFQAVKKIWEQKPLQITVFSTCSELINCVLVHFCFEHLLYCILQFWTQIEHCMRFGIDQFLYPTFASFISPLFLPMNAQSFLSVKVATRVTNADLSRKNTGKQRQMFRTH